MLQSSLPFTVALSRSRCIIQVNILCAALPLDRYGPIENCSCSAVSGKLRVVSPKSPTSHIKAKWIWRTFIQEGSMFWVISPFMMQVWPDGGNLWNNYLGEDRSQKAETFCSLSAILFPLLFPPGNTMNQLARMDLSMVLTRQKLRFRTP